MPATCHLAAVRPPAAALLAQPHSPNTSDSGSSHSQRLSSMSASQNHIPTVGKPRIVDDLISVILESNHHWWPRDLQRLALVSAGWVGPIRRRLYACPTISSFQSCTLFVRTISENPFIRTLVRGLDLRPAAPYPDRSSLTDRDMASLRYILSLDTLQSLTLGGELAVQAERFIHMMSNTRVLTTFQIDGSYIHQRDGELACRLPASLEWNESIAFRFTRLYSLRFSNMQLSIAEPSIPYSLRISDLVLDNVTVSSGSIQDLCSESWESVRSLKVTVHNAEVSDDMMLELLECCENLESLHIEVSKPGSHGDMFEDDLPLSALRRLTLFDVNVHPQTLARLGVACSKLEQLSVLGRAVRLTAKDWASFLHTGAMPSLKTLDTPMGTYRPPLGFAHWSLDERRSLLASCVARGIRAPRVM